jgi:hypothetical protein
LLFEEGVGKKESARQGKIEVKHENELSKFERSLKASSNFIEVLHRFQRNPQRPKKTFEASFT